MTREEAKQIIDSENLSFYNWFELRDAHYDEVGIIVNDNKWEVYSSDERGYIVTKKYLSVNLMH
ncbi:hypothetical protein [Wohlfahrtiimonas populi]|uniref:hypothetical protein n=1 Tax=Wohlfahrtiimonas populi TaxID=1940240 RepID=UPI001E459E38|nr:hypothetical protein [Wohlfahrtiimonas populi]